MKRFLTSLLLAIFLAVAVDATPAGAAPKDKAAPKPALAPPAAPPAEAAPASPTAPPAVPAPLSPAAVGHAPNPYLEEARRRAARGQFAACLEELSMAENVQTNSVRQWADVFSLKATCAVLKPDPDDATAKAALVEFLHYDPKGDLGGLPEQVKAKLEQTKAERVVILHERLVVARAGRPIRVRARVNDPKGAVAAVNLYYRLKGEEQFKSDTLEKGPAEFSGYVRVTPPEGVDNVPVEYYLVATNAEGVVLDSNGSALRPIPFTLSSTLQEESGAGKVTAVFADEQAIKPPPPPEPAFYEKWWFWTIVAVVAVGGTTALIWANQPEPVRGTLGQDLPEPGRILLPLQGEGGR